MPQKREPPTRPAPVVVEVEVLDHDEVIAYLRRRRDTSGAQVVAELKVHEVPVTTQMLDYLNAMHARWLRHQQEHAQVQASAYRDRQRRRREESWVYFIAQPGRIKIGVSVDPVGRALALSLRWQDIVGVVQAGETFERSLHRKFAHHRIGDTEWFHDCEEIRRYIADYADRFTAQHPAYRPPKRETRRYVREQDAYGALLRAITRDTRRT